MTEALREDTIALVVASSPQAQTTKADGLVIRHGRTFTRAPRLFVISGDRWEDRLPEGDFGRIDSNTARVICAEPQLVTTQLSVDAFPPHHPDPSPPEDPPEEALLAPAEPPPLSVPAPQSKKARRYKRGG